jgi:hypothetical protein
VFSEKAKVVSLELHSGTGAGEVEEKGLLNRPYKIQDGRPFLSPGPVSRGNREIIHDSKAHINVELKELI